MQHHKKGHIQSMHHIIQIKYTYGRQYGNITYIFIVNEVYETAKLYASNNDPRIGCVILKRRVGKETIIRVGSSEMYKLGGMVRI